MPVLTKEEFEKLLNNTVTTTIGSYTTTKSRSIATSITVNEKDVIKNTIPNHTGMENKELTFGERLVGKTFNPSFDTKVDRIKEICAELADIIEDDWISKKDHSYVYNLVKGKALGSILEAQMCAVKLITLKY